MSVASQDYLDAMAPPGGQSYRNPTDLPFELVQHIGIFFEENLYSQGLNLLFSTLALGTYASENAIVPLPQHIALATTFLVHPSTTTRAKSAEEKNAAHLSLRLLRLLGTLVKPQGCRLNDAFAFSLGTLRSGRKTQPEDKNHSLRVDSPLNLEMGKSDSLWSRGDDFWHVVGWAFNCSVLHPERWERWQVWLGYMCDVMEDDWAERVAEFDALNAENDENSVKERGRRKGHQENDNLDILRGSLIYQFIASGSISGRNRRILRATFADGSTTSVNEFRAVFKKELKSIRTPEKPKKREREVNIDQEKYGDYLSQDETEDESNGATDNPSRHNSPPNTGAKPRRSKRTRRGTRTGAGAKANGSSSHEDTEHTSLPHHSIGLAEMGGLTSLRLRKRLLGILSNVSEHLPRDFIIEHDLYDLFVEHIRPLSLPVFQAFISPSVLPDISPSAQATLCEKLLFTLRESSAPESADERLTQAKLEMCFLPYAAATASVVNNTKISILLEAAIMLLSSSGLITVTSELGQAVESGINRRADRAQDELRRSQSSRDNEPLEWCWLVESGERLMFLLELCKMKSAVSA